MAKIKTKSEIENMSIEKSRAYSEELLNTKPDFSSPEKKKNADGGKNAFLTAEKRAQMIAL